MMLVQPLTAMLLVVNVATGPAVEPDGASHMSVQQKSAAMRPLVRSTTECIARSVSADSRFDQNKVATVLGELIVDAVPTCITEVRAMIDAFDHYFGDGSGEKFFMGPYLNALPSAVTKAIERAAPSSLPSAANPEKRAD
jgi:hypothetical protein